MGEILFASTNKGKLAEVRQVGAEFGLSVLSPADILLEGRGEIPDVDESAGSYSGNSQLKADAFCAWSGLPVVADDTGLEVDALNGRPGVYSARYAGPAAEPSQNIAKLLSELSGVPASRRTARFYCFLYFRTPGGEVRVAEGALRGAIAEAQSGGGGFGYDSIFTVEGTNETLAQLKERKHPVATHRINACRTLFQAVAHCLRAS